MFPENVNTLVELKSINGKEVPVTTSLKVAKYFGKEHFHVMRDIKEVASKCSESFNASNFGLVDYKDAKGETRPMYLLTKDGFIMLAMGYTGAKAMQFKEAYINAFNTMEAALRNQSSVAIPDFTNPAEAARAWANEYEAKQKALGVIAEQRLLIDAQQDELGRGKNYKAVTAFPWLREYFKDASTETCKRIGKTISNMCKARGYVRRQVEDTRWGKVWGYPVKAIEEFRQLLDENPYLLNDIRKK